MENICRDNKLKFFKMLDGNIYDLRIADNHVEIASYYKINIKIKSLLKDYYQKIYVNNLKNIDSVSYAIYLISNQRYWEAHEVLENIWRNKNGIIKKTYQFIILLCVANIHKQRGHIETYYRVIKRAMKINTLDKIENIDIKLIKYKFSMDENYNIDVYFKQIM